MSVVVATIKETMPHEHRVAIDPGVAKRLIKKNMEVLIEAGAGTDSYYSDEAYVNAGAKIVDRETAIKQANIIAMVQNPGEETLAQLHAQQVIIGLLNPLVATDEMSKLAQQNVSVLSFELLPRTISRAQTMDVLSSQASVAGYKAALIGSNTYPKYFPMMITAAGTVKPAKVLVLGTGVAGLQAIGTAKRLGAVVSGYDVRPASRGEVESLGATFLTTSVDNGAGAGGYARELTAEEQQKQQEELAGFIAQNDVVITTAQVPGHKPPLLVTKTSIQAAKPATVFIDLAASELGGNVAGSKPFETVTTDQQVMIIGAGDLASRVPNSASQLFAKNVQAIINYIVSEDQLNFDLTDDVLKELVATHDGEIINPRLRKTMGLEPLAAAVPPTETDNVAKEEN